MFHKLIISSAIAMAMSGVALAGDLPNTKSPPAFIPPPPPPFSWTGPYIGGQMGYEFGTSGVFATVPGAIVPLPSIFPSGVVGGAHIGYNYQFGFFLVGIEGDVNGAAYNTVGAAFGLAYGVRNNVDGSVRGRAGLIWDRWLTYVTGGAAFAGFDNFYAIGPLAATTSNTRVGWTAGAGVEYAIDNNWSVRAEYRYTDYGHYLSTPFALPVAFDWHNTDNRVQVGFSYKFNFLPPPIPVVAKF